MARTPLVQLAATSLAPILTLLKLRPTANHWQNSRGNWPFRRHRQAILALAATFPFFQRDIHKDIARKLPAQSFSQDP